MYGHDSPSLVHVRVQANSTGPRAIKLEKWDHMLCKFKAALLEADLTQWDIQLHVRDLVFVKLCSYRMNSMHVQRYQKQSPRYYGSFKIVSHVRQVASCFALPEDSGIHPVLLVRSLRSTETTNQNSKHP